MTCPHCAHDKSRQIDTRRTARSRRRRYECRKCKRRFTTYEVFEGELSLNKINSLQSHPPAK